MDTELEIQRLLSRVQELERENAILRKQLAALKSCDSLQKGIASAHHAVATFVHSKEPCVQNAAQKNQNHSSEPSLQAASAPVTRTSSPTEKIRLYRSLFRGRTDAYARRWYSEKTQKSGYSPVCSNEWKLGVCEKGRVSCAKCSNRQLSPLDDGAIYRNASVVGL